MRPPSRGVSDVFEPALATVPDPVPVLEMVVVPGAFDVELPLVPGVLPALEPLLAVEVFPVELPLLVGPLVVFVVVEPVLAVDVFDVDVLPVVVVLFVSRYCRRTCSRWNSCHFPACSWCSCRH